MSELIEWPDNLDDQLKQTKLMLGRVLEKMEKTRGTDEWHKYEEAGILLVKLIISIREEKAGVSSIIDFEDDI